VSYITYLNEEFKGGEFVYYDEEKNEILITPKKNMTIIISYKTSHKVLEVTNGIRFSLYTFLKLSKKKLKSII
jgi:Rps23 Pro-64 3,4-dihydroxylase Tpa1-like proline 4-hydroxylase